MKANRTGDGVRRERRDDKLVAKVIEARRRLGIGEGFRVEEPRD